MSTPTLLFDDARFSDYNPQSVCLPGRRPYDIGDTHRLEDTDGHQVGQAEVLAHCTAPFDQLPMSWVARCHLPDVQTRYGLADELEKRWDEFDTKSTCTIVVLDVELTDHAQSA